MALDIDTYIQQQQTALKGVLNKDREKMEVEALALTRRDLKIAMALARQVAAEGANIPEAHVTVTIEQVLAVEHSIVSHYQLAVAMLGERNELTPAPTLEQVRAAMKTENVS